MWKRDSKMKYFIAGGGGFIGSTLVHRLLHDFQDVEVIVFDNFSSGKYEFLKDVANDDRVQIIEGDIKDLPLLIESMKGSNIVVHLASNPDIAKAITDPSIDFWQGTYLTFNVLEAMRILGIEKIIYASGSGIFGDWGDTEIFEDQSPMLPISTYGASKLAGESLISAYSYMFDIQARIFRFANVIGPNATHGVIFDFINKLKINNGGLEILGSGNQKKSYIYVEDVLDAIFSIGFKSGSRYEYYNIATLDTISVTEIANIVIQEMKLNNVEYVYTGKDVGWRGDIKTVLMNSDKIRSITGWTNKYTTKEAVEKTVKELLKG